MASSIFKYGEAQRWKGAVEVMNSETDELLRKVAECLKEVSAGCEGSIVEELTKVAESLMEKFSALIDAVVNLLGALAEVINSFMNFEDDVINGIVTVGKAVLGGL